MDPIVILIVGSVVVGAWMIALARVSRRERDRLRELGVVGWRDVLTRRPSREAGLVSLLLCGPLAPPFERIGQVLVLVTTFAVVAAVAVFLFMIAS